MRPRCLLAFLAALLVISVCQAQESPVDCLVAVSPPTLNVPTTSTTGGTLLANTYSYAITALNANGQTSASNEESITTTGSNSSNTLTWPADHGASDYRVYNLTSGVYYDAGNVTTFTDTGAAGTTGSPPSTNTATATACTTGTNPGNGTQGDYAPVAFGKLNLWGSQLGLFANDPANEFLATPNGAAGIPGLRAIVVADLPITVPELNIAGSWTAAQTFDNSDINLLGSSTGYTTLTSANSSATNYTLTLPANTGTLAETNLAQTWSAAQTFSGALTFTGVTTGTLADCLGLTSANLVAEATCASGGGGAFSAITSGMNTSAAMLVGTGASLAPTGTGTVSANEINGVIQGVSTQTAGNTLTPNCDYSLNKITATTYLIAAPTQSAPTTSSTGGSLAGNTYYYVVTSETSIGQSTASGQQAITSDTDAPPTNGALTATSGGTLAATTYYVESTWVTASGQTTGATETSLAVAADNVLNVAAPASPPSNATGWNVYVSTSSGTETLQNSSPLGTTTAWVEPTTGLVAGAALPSSNTAWLTSTNENVVSWTAVTGATGYIVYRSTTPGNFTNATSYTVSGGSTVTFTDTGAAGTTATPPTSNTTGQFTINAPGTCTPTDGQKLEVKVISPAGGIITYAWPSTILGSTQLALPTTSAGAGLEDYFDLQYDSDLSKWVMLSYNQGF